MSFSLAAASILTTATSQGNYWSWCQANAATWDVCNPVLPIDQRAADIVSRLSLDDKFQALGTSTPSLPSIKLPEYNWWSEGRWKANNFCYVH
jgi:beta-glucosidase